MNERLAKQIEFLVEIDKVKQVFRRTRLYDHTRYENDAEHGWHMAVMALVLCEHANEPGLDLARVVKMALLHDLVEIDAGDTFLYDPDQAAKAVKEAAAAKRIFGLLPPDQRDAFHLLWEEFEKKETPEARFAGALDRLGPVMQNARDAGHAWKKHGVRSGDVLRVNQQIEKGSRAIWEYAESIIQEAVREGHLER
ncbi:MAG: HD domain-containing protein [Spirochaetes bacterium]|nr:HD domain-containing protein [Spirochaetota bacterium]